MVSICKNVMLLLFVLADFIWLMQIWTTHENYPESDKFRAASFMIAFFFGFMESGLKGDIFSVVICLIGFVISEFTVSVVFYEKFKEVNFPL